MYSVIKHFIAAIRADRNLLDRLRSGAKRISNGAHNQDQGERLFTVARPTQDDKEDLLPYIIVSPDGMTIEPSKDTVYADDTERVVTVSILLVERSFSELDTLADSTIEAVTGYFAATDTEAYQMDLTASGVQYDPDKPCYYLTLQYRCHV